WGLDTGGQFVFFDQDPEHLARHRAAARGDKQRVINLATQDRGSRLFQVAFDPTARFRAERYQPRLAAFAGHAQHTLVQANFYRLQQYQLRDPQAAGIHQLQHGAVAQPELGVSVGRRQQGFDLRLGHG